MEMIENSSSCLENDIKENLYEYTVMLSGQHGGWEVEVFRLEDTQKIIFRHPPTPDDILKAIN